ncbi:hypothetical protein ACFQDF_19110 [Ectobacillus funiculus]
MGEIRKKRRKRNKRKIIGYSVGVLAIILFAITGFVYKQLQPQNHFKEVPVVSKTSNNTQSQYGVFNVLLIGSDERKGQNVGHSDSMMLSCGFKYESISGNKHTTRYQSAFGWLWLYKAYKCTIY